MHGKIISSLKTDQNDALVPEVIILATLQKAELTSIFVSGLSINFHIILWKLIQSTLQGLCKLLKRDSSTPRAKG